jgi:hypothetical protein
LERPKPAESEDFRPRAVRWVPGSEGIIPLGALTVVVGPPDLGKSLWLIRTIARASRHCNTYLSNVDDSPNYLTVPRLHAAGAILDRGRVRLWHANDFPRIPDDLAELERLIKRDNVGLVGIDPFQPHLQVSLRTSNTSQLRNSLDGLTAVAQETNTSFALVEHSLKSIKSKANKLDLVPGTPAGLAAAAPVIYLFGRNPANRDENALVDLRFKLGPAPSAHTYVLHEGSPIEIEDSDQVIEPPYLESVADNVDLDWFQVHGATKDSTSQPQASKLDAAVLWLEEILVSNEPEPTDSATIKARAKADGVSAATLRRAEKALQVIVDRAQGRNLPALIHLPPDHPNRHPDHIYPEDQ